MILNDYLTAGLNVVFCGTAAGDRSAARGHFYAGPGNKFWPMLHATGLTAALLRPEDDATIGVHGIGLTDLVKHHSGNDAALRAGMFDVAGFEQKIIACAPRFVAFNGKKAAAVLLGIRKTASLSYGLHERRIGPTQIFILPSTSGQANKSWDEAPWHDLAARVLAVKRNI